MGFGRCGNFGDGALRRGNRAGAGFGLQNRKPNCVGSVSVNSAGVPADGCRGDPYGPLYAAFAVASTYNDAGAAEHL